MTSLRERLADAQHEIWSNWMNYLFSQCTRDGGVLVIPGGLVRRWTRQTLTSYKKLSEEEKDSDRHRADVVLAVLDEIE